MPIARGPGAIRLFARLLSAQSLCRGNGKTASRARAVDFFLKFSEVAASAARAMAMASCFSHCKESISGQCGSASDREREGPQISNVGAEPGAQRISGLHTFPVTFNTCEF